MVHLYTAWALDICHVLISLLWGESIALYFASAPVSLHGNLLAPMAKEDNFPQRGGWEKKTLNLKSWVLSGVCVWAHTHAQTGTWFWINLYYFSWHFIFFIFMFRTGIPQLLEEQQSNITVLPSQTERTTHLVFLHINCGSTVACCLCICKV